ncbi:MAG: quinone oxidoreductase family protein [Alphaproteobacteria bacterium]
MVHAIRVHSTGGPDVLVWENIEVGEPAANEVRLRQTAIGVNFIDVYQRKGLYQLDLPYIPGSEAAGLVERTGSAVDWLKPGDRVAYVNAPGAYCEARLIDASRLVKLPPSIEDAGAAAVLLKGLTAEYLLRRTFAVQPGHIVLFHAAAGGVGLIACAWAAHLGATVIGTVGSPKKVELAAAHGCRHVIDYTREDFVARVSEITDGRGVDVVYDSVGKDTFPGSLDVLKPRGMWVSFGQSSGAVPEFSPLLLLQRGSLFATRPSLFNYISTRAELDTAANALFAAVDDGIVNAKPRQTYSLENAKDAHAALESRNTVGATVLTV